MTTAQELAEWALKLTWSDLPKDVQQIVKEHALDGFGDAVGGRETAVAKAATATVAQYGESSAATIWGSGNKSSVPTMALIASVNKVMATPLTEILRARTQGAIVNGKAHQQMKAKAQ